jgi:hypothetical protein
MPAPLLGPPIAPLDVPGPRLTPMQATSCRILNDLLTLQGLGIRRPKRT